MKTLGNPTANDEQIKLVELPAGGARIIRGAAGSGKTTVAIRRLVHLARAYLGDRVRSKNGDPVNCMIFTYNKTLRGYVKELIKEQKKFDGSEGLELNISTHGTWIRSKVSPANTANIEYISGGPKFKSWILNLLKSSPLAQYDSNFVLDELAYISGRFERGQEGGYLHEPRVGRGALPRVTAAERKLFLEAHLASRHWIDKEGILEWNELSREYLANTQIQKKEFDIVIIDEGQDFTANQIRTITRSLKDDSSLTVVYDSGQRIYRHGYTFKDVGIDALGDKRSIELKNNYRNTKEIAEYVSAVLITAKNDSDASIPNLNTCQKTGLKPKIVKGDFAKQVEWAIRRIKEIDVHNETVGIMRLKELPSETQFLITKLTGNGINYCRLTGSKDWPETEANVGLITIASSKGLEFDHVIILGMSDDAEGYGLDEEDDNRNRLKRLYAMGCSRAKKTLSICASEVNPSFLISLVDKNLYQEVAL